MFPPFYISWFQHPLLLGTIFFEYKLRRSSLSLPCVQMFSSALWSQILLICVRHVGQSPKLATRLHRNISMDVIRDRKRVSSVISMTSFGLHKDDLRFIWSTNLQLDFEHASCPECSILSFGWFPCVWILCADVSEHSVCSIVMDGVSTRKM